MTIASLPSGVRWVAFAGIAALVGLCPVARAQCDARIISVSSDAAIHYDPFEGDKGVQQLSVIARASGHADCLWGLSLVSDLPATDWELDGPDGGRLRYRILDPAGAEYRNDAESALLVRLPPGEETLLPLRLEIPGGQMFAAGAYRQLVHLRLVALGGSGANDVATQSTMITAIVPARAQINLAGSAGAFGGGDFGFAGLDFGELEQGESRTAFLQLRATRPVTLHIRSENGGNLRRVGGDDRLPYLLRIMGEEVRLDGATASVAADPPRTMEGESYGIRVTIAGDPGALAAGEYRDIVTIEAVPN
ncbi:hypothetical protein [Stakelama tenebrarum]|uniref:Spore coat protein U domain-containing protein n=1 Tax=Stakelama tenebrarum TaxID=2711215 RepID=A0A6G6Y294_9SPHN|nr:hypothetical protein [Sphingosinithalassobacter tenebrarum]QIG79045.1 hypothetical protein G5C33_04100 [Sphingosinithalassobacter tenebrarum]